MAASIVLKLGVHHKILQAKGFQRSDLATPEEKNLLNRKVSRADKEMFLAFKYK